MNHLKIKSMFHSGSPVWNISTQLIQRGSISIKFFALAYILGPSEIGRITILLASIALLEAVTDIGINSALIQAKSSPTPEQVGASLFVALIRAIFIGFLLSVGLYFFMNPGAVAINEIILLNGLILAKALICPIYYINAQRLGSYKKFTFAESICAFVDLCLAIVLSLLGAGSSAVIASLFAAELFRVYISWYKLGKGFNFVFSAKSLNGVLDFAKWYWLSGVLVAVLNQSDKFIISSLAGDAVLGKYQVAIKIGQILIADIGSAMCTNFYPKIARAFHEGRVVEIYIKKLKILVTYSVCMTLFVVVLLPFSKNILTDKWVGIHDIILAGLIPSVASVLVTYQATVLRAIGKTKLIFNAMIVQVVSFISVIVPAWDNFKLNGIIYAVSISATFAFMYMAFVFFNNEDGK